MGHADENGLNQQEKPLLSRRTKWIITAVIACLFALSLLLFVSRDTIGHTLMRGDNSALETPHHITVGLDTLLIEENAIRFDKQRHDGAAPRIDLALMWPEMRGYSIQDRNRFEDPTETHRLIFLQITQSTMSRDMSGRIGPIYSQLFEGAPFAGPYGLTGHHLRAGSGYDGEILYTATQSEGTEYAIRCMDDATSNNHSIDDCQRDVRIGKDLSVLYRFSRKNLVDWQRIDDAIVAYINQRLTRSGN